MSILLSKGCLAVWPQAGSRLWKQLSGRSPKLAAFVAFAGPLDLLTRYARRSSPTYFPPPDIAAQRP